MNDKTQHAAPTTAEQVPVSKAPAAKSGPKPESATKVAPPVGRAKAKLRHRAIVISYLVIVIIPVAFAGAYLGLRAHERYVSHVAFSVRSENTSSAMEMLGGLAQISGGSSSSDADILYDFIESSEMVRALDAKLDLRAMWSKPGSNWWAMGDDPWFSYDPSGTIEDLTEYWSRMVHVYADSSTGIIDVEAQAFTREEAHKLTRAIFEESSEMINRLSEIARDDKIRYARVELEDAVERLKEARTAMTQFRNENQIVDPQSLIQGQVTLLASLQEQLAQALISLDSLRQTTGINDPRIVQTERQIEVIKNRISEERNKLGLSGATGTTQQSADGTDMNYANIFGRYEALAVDQQFAEQSYTVALTAYDAAQAEATRQSRYLAAHIQPSQPERSTEPDRTRLLVFFFLILTMIWILAVLVGYALRDRR